LCGPRGCSYAPSTSNNKTAISKPWSGNPATTLRPYDWGIAELALDREALALGKIAITTASGLLPDGTPFSIPDHDPPPAPLAIDADVRDTRIMLALPLRRTGMADVERGEQQQDTAARYRAVAREVRDNNVDTANNSAFVETGERRLRLFLDTRDSSEHTCIGIARVQEKRPDQTVVLDPTTCRPAWTAAAYRCCSASPPKCSGCCTNAATPWPSE
jgi:type VI secretion system protein ImpJ